MTIATRGQGVIVDPPDGQSTNQVVPSSVAGGSSPGEPGPLSHATVVESAPAPADLALDEMTEPDFPHAKLAMLDEKISSPRWVVPVLPDQELESLLAVSIDLCKRGLDINSEACQRFFREGLTVSFTKILTDDAVNSWKFNIHQCIYANCERLVELCVAKLAQDWFPLLDLLAMVLNPNNKFHTFNNSRPSETVPPGCVLADEELYARPPADSRTPRGWLVDLINLFGQLGGFQIVLERFVSGRNLSVTVIHALLRPFGQCYEMLTVHTIVKYLTPVLEMVPGILDNLTDDELKKEAKNESKNDAISSIIKSCKLLFSRIPNQEEMIKTLEIFRLKMILRLLQISSFNGKMNALNEVNKVIASVTYYPHRHAGPEEEEWLTAERMAKWIKENRVLQIVLRDSLHQPQYVEKLEKILRFIIKERALALEDLDNLWSAQAGKHEAIVKNVHDLLAKLAWDFSPEQLDHLFECFQASWTNANKKQRERLLELIRRLAEDDKDGVMAHKVLTLFWNLAHSEEVPTEIMDQALGAHVKILDYSCSQERDAQKTVWLDNCVDELKAGENWSLPALKQIREICCLYEPSPNMNHSQRSHHIYYRQEVIERLQNQHSLVILVTNSLTSYMDKIRQIATESPGLDPNLLLPDRRYNHIAQVQERLNFLRFLLKDGQLWLCADQAKEIWQCLAEQAVFPSDREACFKWFSKLMGEEPDLDPAINKDFFENNILQLDPTLLTESGMRCFERFFKAVNSKEGKLKAKRRAFLMDDVDLIGTEYIWRVVTNSGDEIANRAIELLKEVNTNLGPRLQGSLLEFHETHISECLDRLRAHYDTVSILCKEEEKEGVVNNRVKAEAIKMCRVMKVLQEYVSECDGDFNGERKILPLHRACRGKHLTMCVRFSNPGRATEDVDVFTHSNDTLASLRRQVLRRVKAGGASVKLELYVNGEALEPADDRKMLSQIQLRDKTLLTAKLSQASANMASSPDSSSDSSTSSPRRAYDGPNVEAEALLPGVIMARRPECAAFFFQVADLGSRLQCPALRDGARSLLKLVPPDNHAVATLQSLFAPHATSGVPNGAVVSEQGGSNTVASASGAPSVTVESVFFATSSSQVLYYLEVMYAMLMPAIDPTAERAFEFQLNFMRSADAGVVLDMLTKNNFLPAADVPTRRSAYLTVLKLCKFLLTAVGYVMARAAEDPAPPAPGGKSAVAQLRTALHSVPNQNTEYMLRNVASKLAQQLADQGAWLAWERPLFTQALAWLLPDMLLVKAVIRLAWATSSGHLHLVATAADEPHRVYESGEDAEPDTEDVLVCREALEVLTVSLVLNPKTLDQLTKDKSWHLFIIDLLLICKNRAVRAAAAEQFLLMPTWCCGDQHAVQFTVTLLFTQLTAAVDVHAKQSHEYFHLLCKLVNYAFMVGCPLPTAEQLLANEIAWLKRIRENVKETGDSQVDEAVLEGHLGIAKELLSFMSPERKYELGSDETKGVNLIKELVEDFVFPASRLMLHLQRTGDLCSDQAVAVCQSPLTTSAAFELLVGLCTGCVPNMRLLVQMITDMFYSGREETLGEWDYVPPVGPRPPKGFTGLKNAGATCYMNSVLQQLYMVESIRAGLLGADGAATDPGEDFSGEDNTNDGSESTESADNESNESDGEPRKEYNIGILKQVQAIFGHCAYSRLQYYVPRGLWRHFKLQGEPVNLREQQDAVEFFMSLVESIDEALKALGHEQIMGRTLGGSYSDQKICKECPHRYSKEEPYSVISVDIRNHSTLLDSLEQYVKGELLEGADAYHCDKCNKKVVTVKRLCVKKLPPILAIQLKRFEYDFERVCAIKFNDYFEFPRDLDMAPYTVRGLAAAEGEMVEGDGEEETGGTRYTLTGIVVHSGQASGGHYYSYILHRLADGTSRWHKFDDGDVTECKMEDDEEMKTQCFGGEYMGEVFDHMLKRLSFRRQKRWWNAYMLFYTRADVTAHHLTPGDLRAGMIKMPAAIERSVRKQNIKFMHNRNQFSAEYFQFIRKLVSCNSPPTRQHAPDALSPEAEELSLLSIQLASHFLFHTGFHTKKTLRGAATEWYDVLCQHLRCSKLVRAWFAHHVLFQHPHRLCEYLLSCPSTEVRSAFMKILVFLAHFSLKDGPCVPPNLDAQAVLFSPTATLSDHLLHSVLTLLNKEVSDHGRHLPHYFTLFHMYASLGVAERTQLLNLHVPATFMLVALDEGPGPPIKYQYPELTKLHQVVSQLVRCCDVRERTQSSQAQQGATPLPNPYGDPACPDYIMAIQPTAAEVLFGRTSYVKKIIEDTNLSEETVKLLQFCCWENPHFSRTVLSELLWQIAYAYCHELRHHMDLLLGMLLLEDSWQSHRIHNALKGVPEEREGLFETIQRSKNHYQKRAYQCVKCLVALFSKCRAALSVLQNNVELRRKWNAAVEWLQDELERRPYPPNSQYTYNNWSPPAQSNEATNGYFLERSNSARKTLERACELCPEELQLQEAEVEETSEEGENSQPEDPQQAGKSAPSAPATGSEDKNTRSVVCRTTFASYSPAERRRIAMTGPTAIVSPMVQPGPSSSQPGTGTSQPGPSTVQYGTSVTEPTETLEDIAETTTAVGNLQLSQEPAAPVTDT